MVPWMFLESTLRILEALLIMTGTVACSDAGSLNPTSQRTGSPSSIQTSGTSQTERLEWRHRFDTGLDEVFSRYVEADSRSQGALLTDVPCPLVEGGLLGEVIDAGESSDREVIMHENSGIVVRCRVGGDDESVALEGFQIRSRNSTEFLDYRERAAQINLEDEELDRSVEIVPDVAGLPEKSVVRIGGAGPAWVGDGAVILSSVRNGAEVDMDRSREGLAELVPMVLTALGVNGGVPSPAGTSEDRTRFDIGLTAMIDGLVEPSSRTEVVDDVCPLMERKMLQDFMPEGLDRDEMQLRTTLSGIPGAAFVECRLNHADTSVVIDVRQTRAINVDEFARRSAIQFPDRMIESVDVLDLAADSTGIMMDGQNPNGAMWVDDGRAISVSGTIEGEPSRAEDLTDILGAVVPTLLDRLMDPPDAG